MLSEGLLQRLNGLHYVVRHAVVGRVGGQQTSKRTGLSLDFAEHRNYLSGDDYRYIDWNLYGRLDRLFVKVFSREEDYPVYVLLDASRSMQVGDKFARARELAAALGYVALKDQNRFGVYPFGAGLELDGAWRARSGWKQTLGLFQYLAGLAPDGATDLNHALTQFAHLGVHRGLVLLVSDMFCPEGYDEGLIALRSAGFAVIVLHVLAKEDIDPPIENEVWLTPAEPDRGGKRLSAPEARAGYLSALDDYLTRLQEFSHHHEIGYVRLPLSYTLEETVLERLRGRVLR